MSHPFDRYAGFTDLKALNVASAKSLRKSMRVNTLKCSIDEFKKWAKEKSWKIDPVPWCREGFYVDRENRDEALGKDLLHVLGYVYMQEAASMLPVALLDPKPGEVILDMSAAPGSKTTQIACSLTPACRQAGQPPLPARTRQTSVGLAEPVRSGGPRGEGQLDSEFGVSPFPPRGKGLGDEGGRGLVVASDVQEKRLWSLLTNLQRCGVVGSLVTRKVGQWFAGNMTEKFDRVLCDAPCTAQGTVRKDSDALDYCSAENTGKMAKLQRELLESAVHACKVSGRIVYSTCTLTPEENEGVVLSVLNKFSDQLVVVDPKEIFGSTSELGRRVPDMGFDIARAIEDSIKVQQSLKNNFSLSTLHFPLLRLWPQTYDTEGFFSAVLEKRAPTRERSRWSDPPHRYELIPKARVKEMADRLEDWFGTSFIEEGEVLLTQRDQICIVSESAIDLKLPMQPYYIGLPFGKFTDHGLPRLSHEMATLRGHRATKQVLGLKLEQLKEIFKGVNIPSLTSGFDDGDVLLALEENALGRPMVFGRGMLKKGVVLNRLPRDIVGMFT